MIAEGEAALRREQGAASAEVMRLMAGAIAKAGPQARALFVLSQLDQLVEQAAAKVKNVSIGKVQLVDAGDGRSLPALSAAYPASVAALLGALKDVMGIDVQELFAERAQ
jgi:flotillin